MEKYNEDNKKSSFQESLEEEVRNFDIETTLPLRGFIHYLLPAFLVAAYCFYLCLIFPKTGMKLGSFFKNPMLIPVPLYFFLVSSFLVSKIPTEKKVLYLFSLLVVWISSYFLCITYFYKVRILYIHAIYVLSIVGGLNFLYFLYKIIYIKTSIVRINKRFVEYVHGVFYRIEDSTKLNLIKDSDIPRSFFDRLLAISNIKMTVSGIAGNRLSEKIIYRLSKDDAIRLKEFLHAHTFSSPNEYWTVKERIKEKNAKNKGKSFTYIDTDGIGSDPEDGSESSDELGGDNNDKDGGA